MHVAQKSATFIAHYLNIHHSAVYRELERNSAAMEQQIAQYLRAGLSPEQIAGRCRLEGIDMIVTI
ncbi:MAG: hypothetical protein IPL33_00605 [Sphingobacteriales bacterium]|nr:hypothetical protein [Sphingobacteriales bacterium]MCC7222112.1 hypothetical protein [Chitinophagales bacterium]